MARISSPFSRMILLSLAFALGSNLLIGVARSEDPAATLPDHQRDPAIKSPAEFFGFAIGSRHLRHDQVVDYLRYLAENSQRASILEYGRTHGSRPLVVLLIGNMDGPPKALAARRAKLVSGNFRGSLADERMVMYLGYNVHGDEASAINASPLVAYHLVSSLDQSVKQQLDESVFLLDPALNPDGADRFANWANENRGRHASPMAIDREHVQPWPGGRTNYYWFDLNRDWLPVVHPESQGRLKLFHQWKPNVVLDFHEMSGNSSFFFQPGIPARNNPLTPEGNLHLTREFAAEHARRMDARGELYFTEERFDDFYVGKGSTYPDLHGAVGILFEQGSTRGLKLKNARTDRHFRDSVANQVCMSLSSIDSATRMRAKLLEYQVQFYKEAVEEGQADSQTGYLIAGTVGRIAAVSKLLKAHRIRHAIPKMEIRHAGLEFSPGTALVIPLAQPESRFVRSLMQPLQSFRENIFYDVSSWHLPSAFDVDYYALDADIPVSWVKSVEAAGNVGQQSRETSADAEQEERVGYAFAASDLGAPKLALALQRSGVHLRVTTAPFSINSSESDSASLHADYGTFLILQQPNAARWTQVGRLAERMAAQHSITLHPLASGITATGPDLGSDTTLALPSCNPLLVVGEGTRAYSAGALWHFLDVRMGHVNTLVEARRLSQIPLHEFTCIIFPEGDYSTVDEAGMSRLQAYVRDGGTVIATGSAISWLQRRELIDEEEIAEPSEHGSDDSREASFADRPFVKARDARALESIAGAFLMTSVDPTHPLGYGFPDHHVPVFRDHSRFFAAPKNSYRLAAKYEGVVAGYVSDRNRKQLSGTAAVWAQSSGRGRYILLADNPVFRGYVRGSERFLTNAMLLGPSLSIPSATNEAQMESSHHGHEHQ